jgi:hypothetical protein
MLILLPSKEIEYAFSYIVLDVKNIHKQWLILLVSAMVLCWFFPFFKESTGARSPPEIFVFHQVATLFEQARCSLGEKHWGEEREREREHRLIYINNCLAPELEWFDIKLARRPTQPGVEVSL